MLVRTLTGLLASSVLLAQTFVVDANGGGHFTDLPQAVAAVPSGAVLHVRPGTYSTFTVASKSLTILGDDRDTVIVDLSGPDVVLGPTAASDRILLHNLNLSNTGLGAASLRIADAAGQVVLHRVRLGTTTGVFFLVDQHLGVVRSRNVHLSHCEFPALPVGGDGIGRIDVVDSWIALTDCSIRGNLCSALSSLPGNAGLSLRNSVAFCVGSTIVGGTGYPAAGCSLPSLGPTAGGPGARLVAGSVLHAATCTITGGTGGSGIACRPAGAAGGTGATVASSTLRAVESSLNGGAGGSVGGAPGLPYRDLGGATFDFPSTPGPHATLVGTPAPGVTVTCSLQARAGDLAVLALGYDQVILPLPGLVTTGAVLVLPALVLGPFPVPPAGVLDVPLPLPLSWPLDQWLPFQFVAGPPALTELWAANAVGILAR